MDKEESIKPNLRKVIVKKSKITFTTVLEKNAQ